MTTSTRVRAAFACPLPMPLSAFSVALLAAGLAAVPVSALALTQAQAAGGSPSPRAKSSQHKSTSQESTTLSTVNVSGHAMRPLPPALASAPAVVESVTAAQIHDTVNLMTTAEALKYLPSIEVRERFIGDRNGIVGTRTTGTVSSAESLVYADGMLLSNLLGNSYAFPPRWGLVSPSEIERVDVMYGPFSALYPGNSMGGVITLETRMPTRREFHAAVIGSLERFNLHGTHQRNGSGDFNLAAGDRWGVFSLWATYDHLAAQGHPASFSTAAVSDKTASGDATVVAGARQDIDQNGQPRKVFGAYAIDHSAQDLGKLKLGWDISPALHAYYTLGVWHNDSQTAVSSYLTDLATGQPFYNGSVSIDGNAYKVSGLNPGTADETHLLNALSLGTDTHGPFDWNIDYSDYRYLKDDARSASNYGQSDAGKNTVMDGTGWQTGELRGTWRPASWLGQTHVLTFGYHIDDFRLRQSTYALADWRNGPNGALTAASGGQTQTQALYLQDTWMLAPRWTLTLGGREEYWRAFDGFNRNVSTTPTLANYARQSRTDFSPKAALSFDFTPSLMTRLSFGRAVRYPTVTELYQQVTSGNQLVQNNPNLKPEDVRSYDWTTQYTRNENVFRLSLFQQNLRDALFSQTDTTVSPSLTAIGNIDRARIRGAEGAVNATDIGVPGLDLSGSVTYAQSVVQKDTPSPAAAGKQFPRIPRWRARATLTYHAGDRLTYALGYRYASGAYSTLLNTDIDHDTYGGISRYSVFDAKLSYRLATHLTASIGVDNLGNEKYYVSPHPYPQRTVFAGLRYGD